MAAKLNGQSFPLKYLFTAYFADGSKIVQTPEDRSVIDPEKRSAFYDVEQCAKPPIAFILKGAKTTLKIDLIDGHFELNGTPFRLCPEDMNSSEAKYKLVYFRDHRHDFTTNDSTTAHRVSYRVGWEYEFRGSVVTRTLTLD